MLILYSFQSISLYTGEARGGASHTAPFYFSNFLKFLDEKYQKLELPFLVLGMLEASVTI